jgi:hypothetical protein
MVFDNVSLTIKIVFAPSPLGTNRLDEVLAAIQRGRVFAPSPLGTNRLVEVLAAIQRGRASVAATGLLSGPPP